MNTFDDRNHTRTANEFLKPGPEDIATVKTKAKAVHQWIFSKYMY